MEVCAARRHFCTGCAKRLTAVFHCGFGPKSRPEKRLVRRFMENLPEYRPAWRYNRTSRMGRRLIPLTVIVSIFLARSAIVGGQASNLVDPQKAWALVIGVSNYEHAEPLRYGASDAAGIAEF